MCTVCTDSHGHVCEGVCVCAVHTDSHGHRCDSVSLCMWSLEVNIGILLNCLPHLIIAVASETGSLTEPIAR